MAVMSQQNAGHQWAPQRPGSNSSTRSRRDEVWEMKRQRWLAKQRGEKGHSGYDAGQQAPVAPVAFQDDSLSQFVSQGYPAKQQQPVSAHQPYGERPSSGSSAALWRNNSGSSRGSGGFDGNIASQWNTNVQQDRNHRQARHDPNVSGPHIPTGGQRVTQQPGGVSNIDLSWQQQAVGSRGSGGAPPRMPSSGRSGTSSYASYGGQTPQLPYQPASDAAGSRHARGPSPSNRRGAGAPWGSDEDQRQQQQRQQQQQQPSSRYAPPPFGVDGGGPAGGRAASRGHSRGRSQDSYNAPGAPGVPAGAGRGPGKTPGGSSQIVFG